MAVYNNGYSGRKVSALQLPLSASAAGLNLSGLSAATGSTASGTDSSLAALKLDLSALNALGAAPAVDDVLAVLDASLATGYDQNKIITKKITVQQLGETLANPPSADGDSLGTTALQWSDLYLADSSVIKLGDDQDVTLTHIPDAGVRLNAAMKLQFRDATEFVHSDVDGYMHMEGATGVNLAVDGTDELAITATAATFGGNIVIPDAGNIGSASDTDAMAISSGGVVTFSQRDVHSAGITVADGATIGSTTTAGAITIDSSGNVTLAGDLTVSGATVTMDVATLTVEDKNIHLAKGATGTGARGAGLDFELGGDVDAGYIRVGATDDTIFELRAPGNDFDLTLDINASKTLTVAGALNVEADSIINQDLSTDSTSAEFATLTVSTSLVPDAQDGAALGTSSLQFSDLFMADGAAISFGDDNEIKMTHSADAGIEMKHAASGDDKYFTLTLQTGDTDIAASDKLGALNFQAPDEGTGTDAILVAAGIEAVSEGDFSSSSNATKLSFKTAASEAAAEKMALSSTGVLTLNGGSGALIIPDAGTIGSASDTDAMAISSAGVVSVSATADATSSTSGVLTVAGGMGVAKKLYVGTDLDVNGTANLDAVDIDGAVQVDNTITVGADDTGYDVKFYGATSGASLLWDESADDLILAGAAGLVVPDGQLTLASTAVTSTAAELNVLDGYADATFSNTADSIVFADYDASTGASDLRRESTSDFLGAISGDGVCVSSSELRVISHNEAETFSNSQSQSIAFANNMYANSSTSTISGASTFTDGAATKTSKSSVWGSIVQPSSFTDSGISTLEIANTFGQGFSTGEKVYFQFSGGIKVYTFASSVSSSASTASSLTYDSSNSTVSGTQTGTPSDFGVYEAASGTALSTLHVKKSVRAHRPVVGKTFQIGAFSATIASVASATVDSAAVWSITLSGASGSASSGTTVSFAADGTVYGLSQVPATNSLMVFVNGVLQTPTTHYTLSSTTVSMADGNALPNDGSQIEFRYLQGS